MFAMKYLRFLGMGYLLDQRMNEGERPCEKRKSSIKQMGHNALKLFRHNGDGHYNKVCQEEGLQYSGD